MVGRIRSTRCWAGRRMTPVVPRRVPSDPAERWGRFLTIATRCRSAEELLAAMLPGPVTARQISNHVYVPAAPLVPLQLAPGEHPVRVVEHLLLDAQQPRPAVGLSSAVLVPIRLPAQIRRPAGRGEQTIGRLLERSGAYWTAETSQVEQLHAADASYDTGRDADVPTVRLTRLLSLLGTPVAIVVEEIPLPEPSAGAAARSPPPTPAQP